MKFTVTNTRGTRALCVANFRGQQIELPVEFNTWAGKCFKQAFGDTIIGLYSNFRAEDCDPAMASALLYAGLEGARVADGKLPKPWTEQDAANIIDHAEGGFVAVITGMMPLALAYLPKAKDLEPFPAAEKALEKQADKPAEHTGGEAPGSDPLTLGKGN